MWGQAALDKFYTRRNMTQFLWRHPGMTEALELLDRGTMQKSTDFFPYQRKLDVRIAFANVPLLNMHAAY